MNETGETVMLCHIDDLEEGESKGYLENEAGHDMFFVVKVEGRLYAWRNACPHLASPHIDGDSCTDKGSYTNHDPYMSNGSYGEDSYINDAPMAWCKDAYMNAQKTHITCYAHGALFEPKSGVCIQGPCLGQKLEKVAVRVSEAGDVSVLLADIQKQK